MRWMVIGLLVSLGVLLFAAGGVARHIWVERRRTRREAPPERTPEAAPESESEP